MRARASSGLGTLQALLLAIAFLGASAVIFFLGYSLGQETALRRVARGDRTFRGMVPAVGPTATPTPADVESLYRDLQGKAEKALADLEPVNPPNGDTAEEATTPTAPAAAPPTATPTVKPPTRTPPTATPARTATKRPTATPGKTIRPTIAAAAPPAAASGSGPFSIQAAVTSSFQEAQALSAELRRQGFSAFTAQASSQGQTVYRIRVGRYGTRAEAEAVMQRIQANPKFRGARLVDG